MKILYLITSTEMGGAEKSLADLALGISKEHTVRVLSLRPLGKFAEVLQKQGIEVISFNVTKRGWPGKLIKQIKAQLDKFQPDLVHAMLYWGIELARIACSARPIKLITTPHFDLSKMSFYQRVLDFVLKGKDTVTIAESFSTAQYLISHQKYPKEKVFFLPNSIDKTKFFRQNSLRKAMRAKYHYEEDEVVILQVSRLEPVKNPLLLLTAFRNILRSCPKARLIYVGDGREREKMESFIKETDLTGKVLLAGTQQNINEWLNMADIFVLPSNEESLPLSLLEALQVGLPCVVSRVGDMPLWVKPGENGFVFPPGDITLLSCFLTELCTQKDVRIKQGKISSEKIDKSGLSCQQYQHIYKQLLAGEFSRENQSKLLNGID